MRPKRNLSIVPKLRVKHECIGKAQLNEARQRRHEFFERHSAAEISFQVAMDSVNGLVVVRHGTKYVELECVQGEEA
jgi:hypothetical protein